MTLTEVLTDIGLGTAADEITPAAFDAARKMVLDSLGCALAARTAPSVREVSEQMRDWGGKPEATVLLSGDRIPAPNAAFVNGTLIHALDYDDIHIPASLHIMSVVLPAALAAAEMAGASGRDLLAGVIMGVEVAGRLGIAERPARRGGAFLPSSLVGGFGAVVAASRIMGLPERQCVDAMGVNYAQTSGNRQALHDMTLTKRLQPALAARSAMWAVALAARGITGAPHALEGASGYFHAYLDGSVCTEDDLRTERPQVEIERLVVKPYTSCGACHSAHAAADRLVAEERLRPEDIERVELFGCGPGGLVGGPFRIGENPQVDAQFSVRYAVATALLRGPARLEYFTDEDVRRRADVAELASSMTFVDRPPDVPPSPESPPDYPVYTTQHHGVIVHTRDGRRLMRAQCPAQTFAPGAATFADVLPKFRQCAAFSGVCSPTRAEEIIAAVRDLDRAPAIDSLLRLLVLGRQPA